MQDKLLPLGTVFKMKDSATMVMIFGYYPINETKERYYRYYGVAYPVGISEGTNLLMFNEDAIDEILFEGFEDEKTKQYNQKIYELIEVEGYGNKILSGLNTKNN